MRPILGCLAAVLIGALTLVLATTSAALPAPKPSNADTAFRQVLLLTRSSGTGYVAGVGHPTWPTFLDSSLVRPIGASDSILIASTRVQGVLIGLNGSVTYTFPPKTFANRVGAIVTANDWTDPLDSTFPVLTASFTFEDGRTWGDGSLYDVTSDRGYPFLLYYRVRNWSDQVVPGDPSFVAHPLNPAVFQLCAQASNGGVGNVYSDLQTFSLPDSLRNTALHTVTFASHTTAFDSTQVTSAHALVTGCVVWPQFRATNRTGDTISVIRQDSAAWASHAYGGYYSGILVGAERTIGDLGCGISCIAMLHNYFHVTCDPDTLNHWLQRHQGFNAYGGVHVDSVGTVAPGSVVGFTWSGGRWPIGQSFVIEGDTSFVPLATIRVVAADASPRGRAEFVQVFRAVGAATILGRDGIVRSDPNQDLAARGFSQGHWSLVGPTSGSSLAAQVEQSLGDSLPVALQVHDTTHVVLADGRKPVWESGSVARGTYTIADPLGDSRDLYHTYLNKFTGISRPVRSPQYPLPGPSRATQVGAERGISVIVDGPATVYIQAPSGGTISFDQTVGAYVSTIPGAIAFRAVRSVPRSAPSAASPLHDAFYIPEAGAGNYMISVAGVTAGRSGLSVEAYDLGGLPSSAFASADYSTGQTAVFRASWTPGARISLGLLGLTGVKQTPRLGSISAAPNPAFGPVRVSWQLARDASGSVTVCDVAGRRVAVLANGKLSAGVHSINWAGVDQHGRGVRPGVYFVRVVADDFVSTARFVLLGGS